MGLNLLFCDSCQHVYNSKDYVALKWTAQNLWDVQLTASAYGNPAYGFGGGHYIDWSLPGNLQDIGMAYRINIPNPAASLILVQVYDGTTLQADLRTKADGSLSVTRNGTELANSGVSCLQAATFYHIETIFHIADAGGWIRTWVNGDLWVNASGDTKNTGNAYGTKVRFAGGGNGNLAYAHDFVVRGGSGASNTDNLGDRRVNYYVPAGGGHYSDWTPSTGSNYQTVDETNPSAVDYNADSTPGHRDSFTFNALPAGALVVGGQVVAYVQKTDAGSHSLKLFTRESGADYDAAAAKSITDSLLYHLLPLPTQGGGSAWDKASWDAAEVGYKLES